MGGLDALNGPIAELLRTKYHHVVSARTVGSITTCVCLMCLTVLPLICGGEGGDRGQSTDDQVVVIAELGNAAATACPLVTVVWLYTKPSLRVSHLQSMMLSRYCHDSFF